MYLITFSGLDGCGKSTHVERTVAYFARRGVTARAIVTVNVSATGVLLMLRRLFQKMNSGALDQKTVVAPSGARIRVYSKGRSFSEDRQRMIVLLKRWLVYPFDSLALRATLLWLAIRGVGAVVCDRYTFDKLVNLPRVDGALSAVVRWLAPSPDLAFFLDVDPDQARARREEHDASYYETKYASYRAIVHRGWGLESVEISTADATQRRVEARLESLPGIVSGTGAAGA